MILNSLRFDRNELAGAFGDLGTDLPAAVRDLTGGRGVHVVYDGVGADTFDASLASLRVRGTLVLFGGSSGQVPPFDLQRLNAAGSLFVTRPTLAHHAADPAERAWRAREVFDAVAAGSLTVRVGAAHSLADAARANKLKPDEMGGGTITVTSLGPLGGIATTPVINRPEVAIIGPNKIVERPVFDGDDIRRAKLMNLSISCDHRVVDGWDAASYVQALKRYLETPVLLFAD